MTENQQRTFKPARILIFGIGDLGVHIARLVAENHYASVCMLAGHSAAAEQWAALLNISTGGDTRAAHVNGLDEEAISFNKLSATGEGIERIDPDGTLVYTQAARDDVAPYCPELAEPLKLSGLEQRLALLKTVIESRV